jgi:transcriptional regulator with XRE-family HTH domain
MSLGQELKDARTRMGLTASEVASATRMKVQIVEAIEEGDHSVFAAPIYGKGFIRLFAEYVGLDPRPLVDEFTESFASGAGQKPRPTMQISKLQANQPPEAEPEDVPEETPDVDEAPEAEVALESGRRRAGKSRSGRQFDLFNDLPEDAPSQPSVESAPPVDAPPADMPLAPEEDAWPPIDDASLPDLEVEAEDPAAFTSAPEPTPEPEFAPESNFEPEPEPEPEPEFEPEPEPWSEPEPEVVPVDEQVPDTDLFRAEDPAPQTASESDPAYDADDNEPSSPVDRMRAMFSGLNLGALRQNAKMPQLVLSGVGVLIILIFIVSGVSRCVRKPSDATNVTSPASATTGKFELGIDVPDPYFD